MVTGNPGTIVMNLIKQALMAVLAAAWIVGPVHQVGSWPAMAGYFGISLLMAGIMFGDRRVLRFAPRRNRRR
jgi:hypothetical protein